MYACWEKRSWRTLTQSILHTLKSLIWAVVLLLLIVYTLLETIVCVCVFYVSMFKDAFKSMPILKHEVPRWLSPSRPMAHGKIVGCFSNFWQMTQACTCCLAVINVPNTSSTRMV